MNVLKNLKRVYWRALGSNKWHAALKALELHVKYTGMFERQGFLSQRSPEVTRVAHMTEQQGSVLRGDGTKLHSALKHPPPTGA